MFLDGHLSKARYEVINAPSGDWVRGPATMGR
jgi:hypothetical protein